MRFRGGRQIANRAPNITELFTPRGGSVLEGNAQDNLTDQEPEVVGATSTNNALGSTTVNYDPFGRRYFVGLSMSF